MGKIERDGIGGPKNAKAAAHWFLRAAEQGYAKAQNHIGLRYARGEGVAKDGVKALFWLTLAARQGQGLRNVVRRQLGEKRLAVGAGHRVQMVETWRPQGS